jgi:hypothetical protein
MMSQPEVRVPNRSKPELQLGLETAQNLIFFNALLVVRFCGKAANRLSEYGLVSTGFRFKLRVCGNRGGFVWLTVHLLSI